MSASAPSASASTSLELVAAVEEAESLAEEGRALELAGDPEGAVECFDRALALLASKGRHPLVAELLYHAGLARTRLGRTSEAEELFHESLEVAAWCDDRRGQAYAVNCLGVIAQRRGDLRMAEFQFRRAARLASEAREFRLSGMVEQNLGVLANIRGDVDSALVHYRRSRCAFEEGGYQEGLSWVLNNTGMLQSDVGRYAESEQTLKEALALAQALTDRVMEGLVQLNLGEALVGQEKWSEAREAATRAMTLAEERGDWLQQAEALKLVAVVDREYGKLDAAIDDLEKAQRLAVEGEDILLKAEILRELGECWVRKDEPEKARAHWSGALERFEELDAVLDAAEIRERLDAVRRAT